MATTLNLFTQKTQLHLRSTTKVSTMDGLDEDNLSQMIRDYIELGSRTTISSYSPSKALGDDYESTFVSLKEILENVTDVENEIVGKVLCYLSLHDHMEAKKLRKWIVKKLGMDCYEACLCKTSWITSYGRSSALKFPGEYEYIDVMMKNGEDGDPMMRLIVDIDFKSQFGLARPTAAYQELSNSLPSIFVGTEEKLVKIISLLSSAAKHSLKKRGLHIPPWRKASYMKSKWFSENCKKISFSEIDDIQAYELITGRNTLGASQFSRWKPAFVKHWH